MEFLFNQIDDTENEHWFLMDQKRKCVTRISLGPPNWPIKLLSCCHAGTCCWEGPQKPSEFVPCLKGLYVFQQEPTRKSERKLVARKTFHPWEQSQLRRR